MNIALNIDKVLGIVIISLLLTIFFQQVYSEQVTGQVTITNSQNIPPGGTGTIITPQGEEITVTLPPGQAATLTGKIVSISNPTSGGSTISFLAEVLELSISPSNACSAGCEITFTFDDSHLAVAGITDPNDVIIFQDPEGDETFVSLPTFLIDGPPQPYTVATTVTGFSLFGIGVLDEETFCGKTIQQWESEGANIIFGTPNNDKLIGTNSLDVIIGLEGNDRIFAKNGDDCIEAGPGNDRIVAGDGNDLIFGDDGNDRIFGGKGDDTIDTGSGNDRAYGNFGEDKIEGGLGNDILSGGWGEDIIRGNEDDDKIFGGHGDDKLFGNEHNDLLNGGKGDDLCDGGTGHNRFISCEEIHHLQKSN